MKNKKLLAMLCAAAMTVSLGAAGCTKPVVSPEEGDEAMATEADTAEETEAETETAQEEETEELDTQTLEVTDVFESQKAVDEALLDEAESGYSFEEPSVILDPYGTSPLTAVVVFSTEEEVGGTVTVKGKAPENDISGTFGPHIRGRKISFRYLLS